MQKIFSIVFTGSLLIISTAACNLIISQTNPGASAPTAISTETTTPTPTIVPTESVLIASTTPEFAPFCGEGEAVATPSVQCQVLLAEESSTFCSEKKPYNLILFNEGLTYKVLTKGFWCSDAGKKNDKQMVTCTGQMASQFVIQVCDPACVIPTVAAEITQCPQGYNYNDRQGCCTQEFIQLNQNCMATNFTTTSCVTECYKYVKKSKCLQNSFACEWDEAEKECKLRQ